MAQVSKYFVAEATLDFHDYNYSLHPVDIQQILSDFLATAKVNNYHQLLVVTGKGEVVRPAVSRLLKNNKAVVSFKSAGYFNGQSGAFEVEI